MLSLVKKDYLFSRNLPFLYLSTCLSHWRKYQFYESMDTFEISQCTLKKSRFTICVFSALIISTISFICFCFVTPSQSIFPIKFEMKCLWTERSPVSDLENKLQNSITHILITRQVETSRYVDVVYFPDFTSNSTCTRERFSKPVYMCIHFSVCIFVLVKLWLYGCSTTLG